jgi:hypothetical protein
MHSKRFLIFLGAALIIVAGFLPWISVPHLFGLFGPEYEGIEIGWEGDGVLTIALALLLVTAEILFGRKTPLWYQIAGQLLSGLVILIVVSDIYRILEINPLSGFFAATDIGLYTTLIGALIALSGHLWIRPSRLGISQNFA